MKNGSGFLLIDVLLALVLFALSAGIIVSQLHAALREQQKAQCLLTITEIGMTVLQEFCCGIHAAGASGTENNIRWSIERNESVNIPSTVVVEITVTDLHTQEQWCILACSPQCA